jgi:hypothetical protein
LLDDAWGLAGDAAGLSATLGVQRAPTPSNNNNTKPKTKPKPTKHHTTPALARAGASGLFGGAGASRVLLLGPSVALALPDHRAERTESQVASVPAYFELFAKLYALPSSVRHLVVAAGVPLVYPHLTTSERVLALFRALSNVGPLMRLLKALGIGHSVYSQFDEPELLDDLKVR